MSVSHKIAANHNNTGGLALVTSITADGLYLTAPRALGSYSPGTLEPRGNLTLTTAGIKSIKWTWDIFPMVFYRYWQTTYCGASLDSYSGLVTIYTPVRLATEYYTFNAILYLPPLESTRYDGGADWIPDFSVTYENLEAI